MRSTSTLVRATRAMTAVITLWCLGCSGFEPLLEAVLGAEASVMTCGSDAGAMSAPEASSAPGTTPPATVSAAGEVHRVFACGCGSCHSASPSIFAIQAAPHAAPGAAFTPITVLASVVRTPLLPPPQRVA